LENDNSLFKELPSGTFIKNDLYDRTALVYEIFKEWKEACPLIASYFKQRDRKKARKPMIFQLSRFLQVLHLVNGKSICDEIIHWDSSVGELEHMPVNAVERLSFIFEQPDHYQSYIQLCELFSEWEKKSVILLRRKT
jgi:hypothetical protein